MSALAGEGVPVEQFHPEYGPDSWNSRRSHGSGGGCRSGRTQPKETIRAVSLAHGLRASFAPVVVADQVGNGCHLHVSVWSGDRNLFSEGNGPYGLTGQGESILAGLLEHLPALCAIGAPSVTSYLRLVPHHWAGPYPVLGPREPRGCAPVHHWPGRVAINGGRRGDQVCRRQCQPLSAGGHSGRNCDR